MSFSLQPIGLYILIETPALKAEFSDNAIQGHIRSYNRLMPSRQPCVYVERSTLHDTAGHVFRSTHLIARFVARKFDSIPLLDITGEAVKKMPWNSGSFFVRLDPQTSAFTHDQLRVHFAQACQKRRPDFVGLVQTPKGRFLEFITDMPSIPLILSQNPDWCFLDENMKPLAIQDMEEPGL